MTISKKLRHETFLDYELRKLSQGHRLTDSAYDDYVAETIVNDTYKEYVAETKKKEFDSQGRHRSEWCYAPYDGRTAKDYQKA